MPEIHAAEMSLADIKRLVAEMEAEATSTTVETARPLVEHLMETHTVARGRTNAKGVESTWVGFRAEPFNITHEGVSYGVTVVVTDRAASQALKDAKVEAEKLAKAKEQHGALLEQLAALQAVANGEPEPEPAQAS